MLIDSLVAQALDDIEEDRVKAEAALRTVAELAWRDGYRQGVADEARRRGPQRPPGDVEPAVGRQG